MPGPGGKEAHTLTARRRHLAQKDAHCPSPRHDHSKRSKGLGKRVPQTTRQNTATSPKAAAKAAASSPQSKSTGQQTQHSLKDSAKNPQQRPKSCCRTTTAVQKYRSTDAARVSVSSPEDLPSKARKTCGPVPKKSSKTRGKSVAVGLPGAIARVKKLRRW